MRSQNKNGYPFFLFDPKDFRRGNPPEKSVGNNIFLNMLFSLNFGVIKHATGIGQGEKQSNYLDLMALFLYVQ
jgi:hypothetical protein